MLLIIVGHSEFAIGHSQYTAVQVVQLVLNVVGRVAVPLFFILTGEHIGPRLLRDRAPGAGWAYVRRLAAMFVGASLFYWLVDIAKLARRLGVGAGISAFVARHSSDPVLVLVYGARPHLWFLVTLMLVVAVATVTLARMRVRTFVVGCAVCYGVGLAIGPYAPQLGVAPGRVWFEWLFQAPLFFALGVFFGLEREHAPRWRAALALIAAGIAIHGIEVYWLSTTHGTSPFRLAMLLGTVPYAAGVGLLAFAPTATALDRYAGRLAAFVPAAYLIHVFFIETMLPPRGQFPELAVRALLPLLAIVFSFGCAALLARLLARRRRRRRLQRGRLTPTGPSSPW
jgi:surface polysaccharide O-acyltransferase-like enzyme